MPVSYTPLDVYTRQHVQRLALAAGLLGAVENCYLGSGGGNCSQQLVRAERTVQTDLNQADLDVYKRQILCPSGRCAGFFTAFKTA